MPKTDATANNGRKRDEYPFCLQRPGAGTDRDTGACKWHGGAGGAPTGWANGNVRHRMYSKEMNEDDAERFRQLVDVGDGEHVPIDEFRATLENMIAFEEMRLTRAIDKHPDVEQIAVFECPRCGKGYRESVSAGGDTVVDRCNGQIQIDAQTYEPCDYSGPLDRVAGKAWVDFGDDAVERKQAHIARLIKILNQIAGTQDVNVNSDVTVSGDGDPIDVNITSVGVDLPDDRRVDDPGDEHEADDGGDE